MLMEGLGTTSPTNDYAYNGKELNEDFGLNLSDYGARWYDAALGRWWSVDPMAEAYAPISTYHYGMNNPILFIDPDGMSSKKSSLEIEQALEDKIYGRTGYDITRMSGKTFSGLVDQGIDRNYGGDNGSSQQNCPTCPVIKKGDYIATTGEHASTDEVVVTGQHMAWRTSWMYSVLGEVGGRKGSLDESQNPYIWREKEITAVTHIEMQIAMAWATGPIAEVGIAGALARYRVLTAGYVNLASQSRTIHILAGDATGGGHAWFGSMKSFFNGLTGQKTMFPYH
jgi:RHS repeat-associated protein